MNLKFLRTTQNAALRIQLYVRNIVFSEINAFVNAATFLWIEEGVNEKLK